MTAGGEPEARQDALGKTTLRLLESGDWVKRRVETVRFVNATTLERRISYDLDAGRLLQIATEAGHAPSDELLLPVIVLRKGLLLDLDLLLPDGRSSPVVSSEQDSLAAKALMLEVLERGGVPKKSLSKAIVETIGRAAAAMPSPQDIETLETNSAHTVQAWRLAEDLSGSPKDASRWAELLRERREFYSMLSNFTLSFMLMTPIDLSDIPSILKLRYVETQVPSSMTMGERLGISPFSTLVDAPGVAAAQREHLRVDGPEGLFFTDAALWKVDRGLPAGREGREPTPADASDRDTYQRRVSLGRVVAYTRNQGPGTYVMAMGFRVDPAGFLRRSQYLVFFMAVLLAAGGVAECIWRTLSDSSGNADATVALLLIVPTVLLAYVAREGDHQMLGDLLRFPRLVIAVTGIVSVSAAASVVIGIAGKPLAWLWLGCALWSALVWAWLRYLVWVGHQVQTAGVRNQGVTTEAYIIDF